jgi:hypothetical protein
MSKMKSTLAATLLTLVFAFPTLGGNIGSPGSTPPPPPPSSEEGGNPGAEAPADMSSAALSSPVIVDILIALLSLF